MPAGNPDPLASELGPTACRDQERLLHRWNSPGGRGVLTNHRCLLLGHPHPLHRDVLWETDLERISSLEVVALADDPEVVAFAQRTLAGGMTDDTEDPTLGVINCEYKVVVDGVTVHVGGPDSCEAVQGWVDDARSARRSSLFGQGPP